MHPPSRATLPLLDAAFSRFKIHPNRIIRSERNARILIECVRVDYEWADGGRRRAFLVAHPTIGAVGNQPADGAKILRRVIFECLRRINPDLLNG